MTNDIDKILENELIIYPNPFSDIIYFNSPEKFKKVSVYNGFGQIILDKRLNEKNELNLSEFSAGTYYLEFIYEKTVVRRKMIKMK